MKLLELDTGLFPDAPRVDAAIATLATAAEVTRLDLSRLTPEDDTAWEEIATAVLGADLIVTL